MANISIWRPRLCIALSLSVSILARGGSLGHPPSPHIERILCAALPVERPSLGATSRCCDLARAEVSIEERDLSVRRGELTVALERRDDRRAHVAQLVGHVCVGRGGAAGIESAARREVGVRAKVIRL